MLNIFVFHVLQREGAQSDQHLCCHHEESFELFRKKSADDTQMHDVLHSYALAKVT